MKIPDKELAEIKAALGGGTRSQIHYGEVVGSDDTEESIGYLRKIMATANSSKLHMVHATTETRGDVAVAVVFDGPDGPDNVRRIAVALNVSEMLLAEVERLRKVEAAARAWREVFRSPPKLRTPHNHRSYSHAVSNARCRVFAALDAAQGGG